MCCTYFLLILQLTVSLHKIDIVVYTVKHKRKGGENNIDHVDLHADTSITNSVIIILHWCRVSASMQGQE